MIYITGTVSTFRVESTILDQKSRKLFPRSDIKDYIVRSICFLLTPSCDYGLWISQCLYIFGVVSSVVVCVVDGWVRFWLCAALLVMPCIYLRVFWRRCVVWRLRRWRWLMWSSAYWPAHFGVLLVWGVEVWSTVCLMALERMNRHIGLEVPFPFCMVDPDP